MDAMKEMDIENFPLDEVMENGIEMEEPKSNAMRSFLVVGMGIITAVVTIWAAAQTVSLNAKGSGTEAVSVQSVGKKSSKKKVASIDTKKTAQDILDKVSFSTELKEMDKSVTESMIDVPKGATLQLYMGSGSYADELIVADAGSESKVSSLKEKLELHISDIVDSFKNYIPKEAKKAEDAVIIEQGKYVIVCISKDSAKAKTQISSILG